MLQVMVDWQPEAGRYFGGVGLVPRCSDTQSSGPTTTVAGEARLDLNGYVGVVYSPPRPCDVADDRRDRHPRRGGQVPDRIDGMFVDRAALEP